MKKQKVLKKWNGRGHGKYQGYTMYVAAYTQKEAAELLQKACDVGFSMLSDVRTYYSNAWGINMDGVNPTEPCVYAKKGWESDKPVKVL